MKRFLSLVKFSHTIFALPFALIGFSLAIHDGSADFSLYKFALVLLCMIFARSAAMAFNRYIDREFDAKNPRTATREIPAGVISPRTALLLVIICSILFVITCYLINLLCYYLSFVALAVVLGYSYTKRFSAWCHLVLGVGLALAPIGAYLAMTARFDLLPLLFSFTVLFWVSGFDIIYALQDESFDRSQSLRSMPVKLGTSRALLLSRILHALSALMVITAFIAGGFDGLYLIGAACFIGLLIYQHRLVRPGDLSKVNLAFATTNGIASVIFSIFVCADIYLG